jgi:hypothetical protein
MMTEALDRVLSAVSQPVITVYRTDPYEENLGMRFRLTYEGPLRSNQRDPIDGQRDKLAAHKHRIRRKFHGQLKQLWQTNQFLRDATKDGGGPDTTMPVASTLNTMMWGDGQSIPFKEWLARRYTRNGYRFVPLVCREHSLYCSLHVLFLRREEPGALLHGGDLDNRVKTLIDTLRLPADGGELEGNETPSPGEDPFFCLLDDDRAVTSLAVETDLLLDPPINNSDDERNKVRLVITVEIKPYNVTLFNLSFS